MISPPVNPLITTQKGQYHAVDYYLIWKNLGLIKTIISDIEETPLSYKKAYSTFPMFIHEDDSYTLYTESNKENDKKVHVLIITTPIHKFQFILKRKVLDIKNDKQFETNTKKFEREKIGRAHV